MCDAFLDLIEDKPKIPGYESRMNYCDMNGVKSNKLSCILRTFKFPEDVIVVEDLIARFNNKPENKIRIEKSKHYAEKAGMEKLERLENAGLDIDYYYYQMKHSVWYNPGLFYPGFKR